MSKKCRDCSKEIRNKANFCDNCGFPFISIKEQSKYRTYIKVRAKKLTMKEIEKLLKRKRELKNKLNQIEKADDGFFNDWNKRILFLMEALEDSINGIYSEFSEDNLKEIAFAILYLLNPFGLIPDFIPCAGYTDDEAIIATVWFLNKDNLEDYGIFKRW